MNINCGTMESALIERLKYQESEYTRIMEKLIKMEINYELKNQMMVSRMKSVEKRNRDMIEKLGKAFKASISRPLYKELSEVSFLTCRPL